MDKQKISQKELAEKTGICKSSISQYLSGKNKPKTKNVMAIADVLNVPVEWLTEAIEETEDEADIDGIRNLPVATAAKLMGIGKQTVREGLKNGTLPFGYAILMPSGKYRFYISPKKVSRHLEIEICVEEKK